MTARRYALILLLCALAAFILCACDDLDRSGFEATATASVRTEQARIAAETEATRVAERKE